MVENGKGIGDQLKRRFKRLSQCPVIFNFGRMAQYQCVYQTINPYRPCPDCKENGIIWPPPEFDDENWPKV